MKTIAILCGRYLPGYKDGGPVRTIVNLVDCLGKEYRFKIVTNDRDHGDTEAYPNIKYDGPNMVGDAEVWYVKPHAFKKKKILEVTKDADLIYICGPYDDYAYITLFLKRIGKIKQRVVVAAMGSFSKGAFQIKNMKKKIYILLCKMGGLFEKITWSVTSELEEQDVKYVIGRNSRCIIAEDLPRKVPNINKKKINAPLRVVFISRICKKKNLLYAIEILGKIKSDIVFDIYGTLEDVEYWNKCQKVLNELPRNIIWAYKGVADSESVIDIFSEYHIFLFPTRGENYGHVIFEALAAGCVPIISDQTPWIDLEASGCGIVKPLDNQGAFVEEIEKIVRMPEIDIKRMCQEANSYAQNKYKSSLENTGYRIIFG